MFYSTDPRGHVFENALAYFAAPGACTNTHKNFHKNLSNYLIFNVIGDYVGFNLTILISI